MSTSARAARTFAEVTPQEPDWLWPGYVPAGLLTVVIAEAGTGKSLWSVDLAARVSRGDAMPDGSPGVPAGPVLLAALEDAAETSVVHRLIAARATLANVVDASGGPDGDGLELTPEHVSWLREQARLRPGTRLIIVDTLSAAADKPLTSATALKRMLKPLNRLARDTGAAVVLIAHTRKDGRAAGSQALLNIPRMVLGIERSKDDPEIRTLSVLKSNITSDTGDGVRYTLAGKGTDTRVDYLWDAAKRASGPAASGQARILLLLRNASGPLSVQEISARTGITYPVAKVLLGRLVKHGDITRAARGSYSVPEKTDAA